MDAVVLREFGEPDVLRLESAPDPVATPGWVTVRLKAAALNWHDVLVRQGKYSSPLPHVLGADGAGIRTDTGEEVLVLPSLWWGDREAAPSAQWEILGDHQRGTYAEFVRVPADCVAPKPRGLSWEQAAALPLVGLTTYRALFTRGRLRAGENLLVLGAGGGVATMAVMLAAAVGAHVTVTSSSTAKIAQARELGAADGVLYTEPDWPHAARHLSPDGQGYDLVLDSVGTWQQSIEALRPGGRLVVLGASRSDLATLDVRPFYFGQYELIGTTMGSPQDFTGLLKLLDANAVPPVPISAVFPLAEAADAHKHLEQGSGFGKIVLSHG
ncbi:quinone oxidoreductase family protein [Rhodococcus jostii]|uniref:NADPH:quinone reductase n=1 Tax=Rhodococcus jostii TaxID=132919 RepID=A0A1H5A3B5_RHOJO|nr:zinc-binding dehydrogenase [Rhodococcus jostii]SED36966.1 NADPH:quinone reductase [Rhodococcus jostii]